ncbi:gag-pol polyprotein [Tanacetum coccineum]
MAKISKVHTFLFVFLVVFLLVVNPGMVAGTKKTNKVCERRSKTWSGYCGDSKHCDQQCREWEGVAHGVCHRQGIVIVALAAKFKIEKFNGNNFSLWKLKMKDILTNDKCLAAIGERPVEVTDDNKWAEMDENAIANLHLALADGVLSRIEEKKTAKDI